MDKPTKVTAEQTWRWYTNKNTEHFSRVGDHWVDGDGIEWTEKDILTDGAWACLDLGPQPPKASQDVRPVMEANAMGNPVSCLFCGVATPTNYSGYACEPCILAKSVAQLSDAKIAWDKGARDFPRPQEPTAAIPGPAPQGLDAWLPTVTPQIGTDRPGIHPKPNTIPASCQLERWNETGPLTALGAIAARRSSEDKPAPPYVPSVDEWDLLPDAPGFGGRR